MKNTFSFSLCIAFLPMPESIGFRDGRRSHDYDLGDHLGNNLPSDVNHPG